MRCPSCEHRFALSSISLSNDKPATESNNPNKSITNSSSISGLTKSQYRSKNEPTINTVGRFELKEQIGQGGFGQVFRAYDPQLERQVALKVPKFAPKEKKKIKRFLAEARAAASLHHPNIVAVYERGRVNGEYYIASEYVMGDTLAERIAVEVPTFRKTASWVRELANALEYAHSENIVHRDIKPDNIMVGKNDRPQIMDFGLAKRLDEDSSMTADGGLLGTPAYMSPEQARGEVKQVGPKSDQYSLGVVFYELLTGQKPFDGPPHSIITKVTLEEPPAPQTVKLGIPDDLQAICLKAMSKDFNHRYVSLAEMAEDLDRWLEGYETVARPIKTHERFARWCRRNPLIAGLSSALGIALVVGVIVSTYFAVSANRERDLAERQKDAATRAQKDAEKARELEAEHRRVATQQKDAATQAQREAEKARELEAKQRRIAEQQKNAATRAQKEAEKQRLLATRRLAESYFDNGMNFLNDGKVGRAFAMLVRCAEVDPQDSDGLHRAVRLNLALIRPLVEQRRSFVFHDRRLFASDFSHDGKRVATGSTDGLIRIWDPKTGLALLRPIHHEGKSLRCVRFSPDGRLLVSSCEAGLVRIWNSKSGEPISSFKRPKPVGDVAFNNDGSLFVTGEWSGHVQIWNTQTGQPVGDPLQEKGEHVSSVAFSPDGRYLAVAGKVRLWNAETRTALDKQPPEGASSSLVAFSPDSRFLVYAGKGDGNGHVWDIEEGKLVGKPIPYIFPTRGIALSSDSEWLAYASENKLIGVWNFAENKFQGKATYHSLPLMTMSHSPDDQLVLTGDISGRVQIWQSKYLRGVDPNIEVKHDSAARSMVFSPTGELMATANRKNVQIWNANDGQLIREFQDFVVATGLKFSPNGRFLVGEGARKLVVWDLKNDETAGAVLKQPKDIYDFEFSSDSKYAVVAGKWDRKLFVWDLSTGKALLKPIQHPKKIFSVGFVQGTNQLISVTIDGKSRRWDIDSGKMIGESFQHGTQPKWPFEISPDGNSIAIPEASGFKTRLWNWTGETWAESISLSGRHLRSPAIFFSDDSQSLFVGGANHIRLWKVTTGQQNWKTIEVDETLDRFGWTTTTKDFVLAGTQLTGIQLWDMHTGEPIGARLQNDWNSTFALSPRGNKLAYGTADGTSRIQNIPQPLQDNLADLKLWIEAMTALELTDEGTFRPMTHERWYSRITQLYSQQTPSP